MIKIRMHHDRTNAVRRESAGLSYTPHGDPMDPVLRRTLTTNDAVYTCVCMYERVCVRACMGACMCEYVRVC